jgi:predicted nuclease of predicted toxin-antitoxin system
VRFLIDRCAGRRLAEWLEGEGHEVSEARRRGPDPGDATLLEWAAAERRVLITIDTDFGALVRLRGAPHAGLIRLPDLPAAERIALMRQILQDHAEQDLATSVVTVRGNRIRLSRWPHS